MGFLTFFFCHSEFAGKVCVYTDASGHHIPPPLERAGPTSGAPYPDQLSHDFIQTEQKKRKATQAPPLVIDHRFTSAADGAAGPANPARSAISDTQSPSEHPSASPQDVGIDSVIAHELVNRKRSFPLSRPFRPLTSNAVRHTPQSFSSICEPVRILGVAAYPHS